MTGAFGFDCKEGRGAGCLLDMAVWNAVPVRLIFVGSRRRLRIELPARDFGWDIRVLPGDFCMLEACCGSGASSRAMIVHVRRLGG